MSQPTQSRPSTIQSIKGMEDLLPETTRKFRHIEDTARRVFTGYGYGEIRTPILEPTELFARAAGEASDIMVSKQMYTFDDPGERSNTMRPEGTAGVVRAMVESGAFKELPIHRLYYTGPMFRYEKPQKGRLRQFHQVGVELFGVAHPAADAEVITLCYQFLTELGFNDIITKINTIGSMEDRRQYNQTLRDTIQANPGGWCEQCRQRALINPMRVFDCKVEACNKLTESLPRITESVSEESRAHFQQVTALLDAANVPYEIESSLVRGFDYYTHTVFEVIQSNIGAQSAILGGGRYDGLVEELGGPAVPAVGMGIGMERLILSMEAAGIGFPAAPAVDYYALAMDAEALPAIFEVVYALRRAGKTVAFDCQPRTMKAGFKAANRVGAREMLILGSNERERGIIQKKNLETGQQIEEPLSAFTQ